jgi:hypothetical protein
MGWGGVWLSMSMELEWMGNWAFAMMYALNGEGFASVHAFAYAYAYAYFY